MREIKFRAWSSWYKKMCYYDLRRLKKKHLKLASLNICLQKEQRETLMQYTGLKDKNGKEIYEGDILKMEKIVDNKKVTFSSSKRKETSYIVKWESYGWDVPSSLCSDNPGVRKIYKHTIIGNIYENPELLETK